MKTNHLILLLFIGLGVSGTHLLAQTERRSINQKYLQDSLFTKEWFSMSGDTALANDLIFKKDSCYFGKVYTTCALYKSAVGFCAYDIQVQNDFFELRFQACEKPGQYPFLYGYFSNEGRLYVLGSKDKLVPDKNLLLLKGWSQFHKWDS